MRLRGARRLAALAAAGSLLVGRAAASPPRRTLERQDPTPQATPTSTEPTPDDTATDALPAVPAYGRPAALAAQLDRALAVLRDDDSSAAELREAGELQQLATRSLALSGPGDERAVTSRLSPQARPWSARVSAPPGSSTP